ncbi:hypothetical protein, partial [uncultured Oscillibacter sp.]|uniref:hypothetical protein n=1 Tax=uncultured Oscillibacter sp. TaxID=876091 RepID=UPI00261688BE
FLRVRMSSARGVVRAGVLEVIEWTPSSFCCRTPVLAGELRLPGFEELRTKRRRRSTAEKR